MADDQSKIQDLKDSIELYRKINEKLDAANKKLEEINKKEADNLSLRRRRLVEIDKEIKIQESLIKAEKGISENLEKRNKIIEKIENSNKDLADEEVIELILQKEALRADQERHENIKSEIAAQKKRIEQLKEEKEIRIGIDGYVSSITTKLIGSADYQETWLGFAEKTLKSEKGISTALDQGAKSLASAISPLNLYANLTSKVFQSTGTMVLATDQTLASFNRATGAGGRFNKQIIEIGQSNFEFGVGMAESGEAFTALHSRMSAFTTISRSAQSEIAGTTARLIGLGISGETTAQSFDILTRATGMSATGAEKVINTMADFSDRIGVSPAQLMNDFVSTAPQLAAHGPKMINVFKELAKTSKATGIEMQTLLGIAKQFDTFEGAADAAGRLNAMLGGNLVNSVQLLNANEADRIKLLRQAVQASGRSWAAMNRQERQAIATAAGIQDMDAAARLFGTSDAEFRKISQEQKTLQERAQATKSVIEKLSVIFQAFAIALDPIISLLHKAANWVLSLGDDAQMIIGILFALGTAWFLMSLKMKASSKIIEKVSESIINKLGGAGAGAIEEIGQAATKSGPGLIKLGAAFLLMGAGIGLAALGLSEFVKAFQGMNAEQILSISFAIAVLIGGMGALAIAGVLLAKPLLLAGAGFLLIGASIWLATTGITKFIEVLANNLDKIVAVAIAIGLLAIATGLLAIAIGGLVFASLGLIFVLPGFLALALGIGYLAASLLLIKTEDIMALAEIAKSLDGMTIEKSIAMKGVFEGFEALVESADVVTPKIVENVQKLTQASMGAAVMMVNTPASSPSGAPTQSGGQNGVREVVLKINERELARAVVDLLGKEIKLYSLRAR